MAHLTACRQGHIFHIELTRPEKYNALSVEMYHQLGRYLAEMDADPDIRVGVLSAQGRNFTAGVELDQWAEPFGSGKPFPVGEGEIDPFGLTGERHRKPLVMAAQGYCFTWGVEIMLNTEIRVAASDTLFQMLEVQRGLYPCGGATLRLPAEIGWGNAHRYLLTGDRWTAEQALQWGMVQEIVAPGEQVSRALELAQQVADAAPMGVQGCLKATRYATGHSREDSVQQMMADLVPVMASEDAAEGVQSFMERRKAVFKGC